MLTTKSRIRACMIALPFVVFVVPAAHGAEKCPDVSYGAETAKLERLLVSTGLPQSERSFLLEQIDSRLGKIKKSRLNPRGTGCGISTVRATIVGCMNYALPSALKMMPSLEDTMGKTYWGKANATVGEAIVIGAYDTCYAPAADIFLVR